jgi:hypothetical protein
LSTENDHGERTEAIENERESAHLNDITLAPN